MPKARMPALTLAANIRYPIRHLRVVAARIVSRCPVRLSFCEGIVAGGTKACQLHFFNVTLARDDLTAFEDHALRHMERVLKTDTKASTELDFEELKRSAVEPPKRSKPQRQAQQFANRN